MILKIDDEECVGCKKCTDVADFIELEYNTAKVMGDGDLPQLEDVMMEAVEVCPVGAIKVV